MLSVLVRSLLSVNHRVTLEDASYERAGPRHGAGLLFFGVWGGARSRERAQQGGGDAPDDEDEDDTPPKTPERRTKLVEPLL